MLRRKCIRFAQQLSFNISSVKCAINRGATEFGSVTCSIHDQRILCCHVSTFSYSTRSFRSTDLLRQTHTVFSSRRKETNKPGGARISTENTARIPLNSDSSKYMEASDDTTKEIMKNDMIICSDFISEEEEKSLLHEIEPYLKRLRYEFEHWDDAIHGYREIERRKWTEKNKVIIDRVRSVAFPPTVSQLTYVHVLDIDKAGYIKPHVDAVRFCGNTIAGICLLSPAVMRLVHTDDKSKFASFLLQPRSLYIMKDKARYNYTHEILPEAESVFQGEVIPRERRISVICRNEPESHSAESDPA